MLTEALEYPRNHDDWLKTVIIGGILGLFSWLLLPAILVAGYLVRVLRGTMRGDETPPVFDDWGDLFGDGLRAAVIVFVYWLIPSIVVGVTMVTGGAILFSGSDAALGGALIVFVGGIAGLLLSLLAAYVVPAAVANYAETGRVGAGFSWSTLRPVLFSGRYATAWVTGFAIIVAAAIVPGLLNVIPLLGQLLGAILGAFLGFYAAVSAYYVIGRAWGEMHPVEAETMDNTEKSPAI